MLQRIMKTNTLIVVGMIIAIVLSVSTLIIIDYIESQSNYPVNHYIVPYELHVILDNCKHRGNSNYEHDFMPHAHFNGTHAINNLDCKWVTIKK